MEDILEGYAAAATPELVARFEGLASEQIYAPVLDLLPVRPARVADIGAGTGRDAAWFARRGHSVLAVEPVQELRAAGMALYGSAGIAWLDDRLPALPQAKKRGPFDLVTLCAVWQHLDDEGRGVAMPILARMTAAGGVLVLSLRHGPGAPGRRVFPVSPEDTIRAACSSGLALARRATADSVQPGNQANGVRWTWLALTKRA